MPLDLTVQYAVRARGGLPHQNSIRRWVRAALSAAATGRDRRRRLALTVRIVDGRESAALNRRYRGKRGATNVLAFPFAAPPGMASDYLGDVVICAPVVRREARAQGKAERAHWAHMVVHGIMHLQGYDHASRRQAAIMEGMETRILARLGFPDPYAAAPPA